MAQEQYTYAVARIRSKELALFGKQTMDQLMSLKTYKDCLRLLSDKGWNGAEDGSMEHLLSNEREKTWNLMRELVEDMSVFNCFLYENDYHNLKAAIKEACLVGDYEGIFIANGTIEPKLILEAVEEKKFELLPEHMRACAQEAFDVQLKTGDSQLCDVIVDASCLQAIYREGMNSGCELFTSYARTRVAAADIGIAIRCCRTGKDAAFITRALVPCDELDIARLTECSLSGEQDIYEYLVTTTYEDAVPEIKKSLSAFERWCDNRMMEQIRPEQFNPFTIAPLAAYILARENEIKSVRILLSGKLNDLPEESIRERLREMYV